MTPPYSVIIERAEKRLAEPDAQPFTDAEVREICAAYRSLESLLSRTLSISDLSYRGVMNVQKSLRGALSETREANTRLTSLDAEKNDLLALAAHDLRSPVATMASLAEALESLLPDGTSAEAFEFLGEIRNLADHTLSLVTNILEGYRLMDGNLQPSPTEVRSGEFLQNIVSSWTSAAGLKGIRIEAANDSPDTTFLLDEKLFRRVADNLVSNAVKYSPRGGTIRLRAGVADSHVLLDVEDDGAGISETDQLKLFKRFARIDSVATAGETSEGVGLALTARILQILNGTVRYERGPKGGSIFRVSVPVG